jgi:hypothetical protein
MNIKEGQLIGNNIHIMNEEGIKKAKKFHKKLMEYEVENLITNHKDPFNNNPNQKIKELDDLND